MLSIREEVAIERAAGRLFGWIDGTYKRDKEVGDTLRRIMFPGVVKTLTDFLDEGTRRHRCEAAYWRKVAEARARMLWEVWNQGE
jgi:hypothetical protein